MEDPNPHPEFVSKPAVRIEHVTDYDFGFTSGVAKDFTVNHSKGDTCEIKDGVVYLTLHLENDAVTKIAIFCSALAYMEEIEHDIEIPIEGPVLDPEAKVALPDLGDSSHTESSPFLDPTLEA